MTTETEQLAATIAALEAQRAQLGDAMADLALTPLRQRLNALQAAVQAPPAQSLRQVTVMFLDVVGSTALSQRLDPETVHDVLDGTLRRCTAVVQRFGGKVLQYAGDSVLGAFGADQVQEDDAERAVHAGLALLALGRELGAEVLAAHGHAGFDVRVGLHSGPVLLGGGSVASGAGSVDDGSIRGITVHIAARMEQSAPAGGLQISHDTYRHVRGVFDVQPLGAVAVKGHDEPIVSYLVERAKPRSFRMAGRGIEGLETLMVGRDAELQQLQAALNGVLLQRRLALVCVVGDAGLGKSRLVHEFLQQVETRPEAVLLFQGRAQPATQNQPYGLLRELLAWRLQLADGDTVAETRRHFEEGLMPLFAAAGAGATADPDDGLARSHVHILGHLIGIDFADSPHVRGIVGDGVQMRQRGQHAAALLFRSFSAAHGGAPMLWLLDDLHFADEPSLDVLLHVLRTGGDLPLLAVALTRPALFERRADWCAPVAAHTRIDLAPLDGSGSVALAQQLLQKLHGAPAELPSLLVAQAAGNPFYMEELLQMLVDQGAITTGGDSWRLVPGKLRLTLVPDTLTGVLQARLDGLGVAEKTALQQASVIGMVLWDQALAAADASAPAALPALLRRELLGTHGDSVLDGAREYSFRHQMLHQVTYATVLRPMRRSVHARTAAWLAALGGARAADFLGLAAEHFEQAGDSPNAIEFHSRAAAHAWARFAVDTVLEHVSRALALLGDTAASDANDANLDATRRWRLLSLREAVFALQGRRAEQLADLLMLQTLAETLDDDVLRAEAAGRRSLLALLTNDHMAMVPLARQAVVAAERAGINKLRLQAQVYLARALGETEPDHALALARQMRDEARALGLRNEEALALNALVNLAGRRDDTAQALAAVQQGLLVSRAEGNRRQEANALTNIGAVLLMVGDNAAGRRDSEAGLAMMRAIGHRAMQPAPLINLSLVALREGDAAAAAAHAQEALEIADEVKAVLYQLLALQALGVAELERGPARRAAAQQAFEQLLERANASGLPYRHAALAGLARATLAGGDTAAALRLIDAVLAGEAAAPGEAAEQPFIHVSCWQVLQHTGDSRADAVLDAAYTALQKKAASFGSAAFACSYLENIPENRLLVGAWQRWRRCP